LAGVNFPTRISLYCHIRSSSIAGSYDRQIIGIVKKTQGEAAT